MAFCYSDCMCVCVRRGGGHVLVLCMTCAVKCSDTYSGSRQQYCVCRGVCVCVPENLERERERKRLSEVCMCVWGGGGEIQRGGKASPTYFGNLYYLKPDGNTMRNKQGALIF